MTTSCSLITIGESSFVTPVRSGNLRFWNLFLTRMARAMTVLLYHEGHATTPLQVLMF
jgi:hypothetical protein